MQVAFFGGARPRKGGKRKLSEAEAEVKELENRDFLGELISGIWVKKG